MPNGEESLPVKNEPLPPEATNKWLDIIRQDAENKKLEIELDHQKEQHRFQIAQDSISSNTTDRKHLRDYILRSNRERMVFVGLIGLMILGFLGFGLYIGKEQAVIEVLKIIIYGIVFGGGGYTIGRYHKK